MCIKELKFRIYRFKNSLTFFIKCDWGFWISKSWDENAGNFTKKDVFGKHFIDLKNENIVGPLKWLHLFYQHLPNKLDSLEKIQNWYIMETEWRITLTGQILTCHLPKCIKWTEGCQGSFSYLLFTQQKLTNRSIEFPQMLNLVQIPKLSSILKGIIFIF